MHRRPLVFALLLLLSFSAAAQQTRNEVAVSAGTDAYGASYNHYWTRTLSTRVAIVLGTDEAPATDEEIDVRTTHASAEYHPLAGRRLSPWLGLGIAHVVRGLDRENDVVRDETKLTPILRGGADVELARHFALGAEVSYMNYESELGDRFGYTADSVTLMASARFRW